MLKNFILTIINDLQGTDIIYIDVCKKSSIMDAMIICTGKSSRHVISISQDILRKFRDMGLPSYGVEGIKFGEWVLVDLGDIIIHVMQQETRKLYQLEQIWI